MGGSVIFYTYGSTLELNGQQLTAGVTTERHVVSSLCLYRGGIHAMLRKRADKLKIR